MKPFDLLGIDLHDSFLKTALLQFRFLYLGSLFLLFLVLAFFYFNLEKERLISYETSKMTLYLSHLEEQLKNNQMNYATEIVIDTKSYKISLYDIEHHPIATQHSTIPRWNTITWLDNSTLYSRHNLSVYFLGVASIVVSKEIQTFPIIIRLATFFIPLFLLMALVGFILSHIAFKPARSAFESLDTFIKHATHDLNTPIAAILSNARILEEKITQPTLRRYVQRITIGAKTLTGLYEDFVYLNFQSETKTPRSEAIDALIHEQIMLLETLIEYKKLSITLDLIETKLTIFADDFRRLINNLLTNAIKYNMPKGSIILTLTSESLSIKDNGIGLSKAEIDRIHERYWRAESFETGLGIGMEIVIRVCKTYALSLDIISTKNQGSEFIIGWKKSLIA